MVVESRRTSLAGVAKADLDRAESKPIRLCALSNRIRLIGF